MMSMRSKQQPALNSASGPSRYDRMAAPGHITRMNTKVNWSEFVEERERKNGDHLPAIPASNDLNNSHRKRAPLSTADLASSDRFTILPEIEGIDIDKELCESLSGPLKDVSRQRLRAIKISFRRLSNMDSRVSMKDVLVVLGEHNVKISNRIYQMIIQKFETDRGMDIDGLWKYMAEAQAKTGRDSIQAINQNKQAASQPMQTLDTEDIALLASINKALKSSNEYDLEDMRSVCQMRDTSRHGLLPRKTFRRICLDHHIPLNATLMRSMLKRCDDEKNGLISWPEFLMLLEKGAAFNPEQYKARRNPPPTLHRPQMSQRKSASPKPVGASRLTVNDAKDAYKGKTRPRSSNNQVSKLAKHNNSSSDADTGTRPGHPTSRSQEPPTSQGSKAAKVTDLSGQKGKSKDHKPKDVKLKENGQTEDDGLSVKSLPSQKKGKAIKWNDPITVPIKSDPPSQASNDQEQKPGANDNDSCKSLPPSGKMEDVDATSESPFQSEASLESEQASGAAESHPSKEVAVVDPYVDPTEQEYLQGQQQKIDRVGSEVTLNGHSTENLSSSPKGEVHPLHNPVKSDEDDRSDVISLAPSDKTDCKHIEDDERAVSNASSLTDDKPDYEGSETSSVCDKGDSDSQSVASLSLPGKPKPQKLSAVSVRKMQAVYGKNPRKQLAPLGRKDQEKKNASSKNKNTVKVRPQRRSVGARTPIKSSPASTVAKETKPSAPVLTPSSVHESKTVATDSDTCETKSLVSQGSSVDSQGGEKASEPTQEGALPQPEDGSNEGPEPDEGTQKEEDGDAAGFMIQGQEVAYYKPDAYVGKELSTEAPSQTLQIDWVYGYRGNDCRCNMYVIEDGVLAYFIGKVAVLYNTEEHSQRHYTQHTAEIRSLAVHGSNVILATGQMAGPEESDIQACIHVWSAETLETLYTAGEGYFEQAVVCLSFCTEEDYLVAVDDSKEHTMSVWHSSSGERLADKELLTEVVCQVAFHPIHPYQLVSIGKEHLCFWKLQKEPYTIEETMIANYETKMKGKYVICLTFHPNGSLLTGDSNGTIYLWHRDGNTIAHTITHAHDGPVFWLMYVKNTLISGGRDGIIQTYSLSSKGTDFTGKLQLPSVEGGVRAIQLHNDRMYIGTTLNCILSASIASSASGPQIMSATINNAPITQGHYDEVRCIVPHSAKTDHFFTAAFDGIVCLYDASLHKAIWKYVVKGINTTCMDVNPNGDVIILGARDGHLVVLTVGDEEVLESNRIKLGRIPVSFIKFAPGGDIFAASCGDLILILRMVDAGQTIEPLGKCQGHMTPVTGFDWSREETSGRLLLQSSSLNHEYLCWDIETFQALSYSSDYRNVSWMSHNCQSGYTVSGVWGSSEDSPEVNSIDWKQDLELLASAMDDGFITLNKYPCANQLPEGRSIHAHCKSCPCVRFLSGSSKLLLSAGGKECTTIQWTLQG